MFWLGGVAEVRVLKKELIRISLTEQSKARTNQQTVGTISAQQTKASTLEIKLLSAHSLLMLSF